MESSRYNTATNASHDASPSTPRAGPSRGSLNPLPRPPSLIPAFADIELGSGTLDPYYPINDTPRAQAREQSSDISLDNVQEASRRFWRTLELYRYLINASRVRLDAEIQSSLINESKQLMHFLHFMNADFMNENYTEEIEAIPQISTHVDLETWLRQREAIERVTERILRQGMLYTILQQEARPTNRVLSPPSQEPSSRARNIFSAPTLRFGSRSTDSHSNLESVGGSPEFSQSSYYSLLQHPCSGGPSRRDSSSRQEAPDTTPSRTYLVPPSPVVVDPELSIRSPRHTRHQVNHSSLPRHHSSSRRADGVSSAPGSRPASPYLHPENLIGFSPPRRLSSVPSTRVPSPSADDHSHPPLAQDSVGSFQPPDLRSQSENVEERELTGTTRRDGARLRFSVPSRSQRNRIFRTSDPRRLSIDSIPVTNSGSSPNEFEAHHSPPPPNQAPGHPVLHNARVRAPDANSGRDDPRFTLPGGSALVEPLTSSAQQNASTTRVDIPATGPSNLSPSSAPEPISPVRNGPGNAPRIDRVAPSVSTTPDTSARDGIANPPPPPPRNPGLPGGSPDSSSSSESNNSRRSGDHGDSSPRSQNGSPDGGQGNGLSYPVWPSTGVSPSNLFPYPGSALPPLPPPSIHYHFAVPTPVPITPQPALQPVLPPPLWSTPAVPSILLTPAGPPPAWEPGTFPVSNLGDPVPVRVHPHLLYNPMNPSQPVLQWDVVLRAEQARVVTGKGLITRPSLGDEAVYVGGKIDKIWIQSDTPILAWWMQRWGPIIIEKSRITVRDVLDAIQTYLSVPLTNGDYRKAVQVQTQTDGINHGNGIRLLRARRMRALNGCELRSVALKRRSIEDGWSARFMGANQGESSFYRRSDVLGTYRRFLGVRSVVYSDNSWRLLLGVGPGPVPQFV